MPEPNSPLQPRRTYGFLSLAVLAVVAVIALAAAWGALVAVERSSKSAVEHALFLAGEDWAEVQTNGLQVFLSGRAPSEAARFAALSAAGHEVDGARVIDQMILPEAVAIDPPRFSIELLRNQAGISLIGLIPEASDRDALTDAMRAIDPLQPVADFLKTAQHPTPDGWEDAVEFMLYAATMLPQSKISMDADHVLVEAIAGSPDQKEDWERALRRERPAGLRLALNIRAPHEVVSPFIMRFLSDEQGSRFDACTAHTETGRNTILSAGIAAGVKGAVDCKIGLGVPSPDWPEAVARGIKAVRDMGGGALTFSDADITLIAREGTPQDTFDRVIGELEADLPGVFSLHGVLPEPETGQVSPAGPPEFIAALGDGGNVQLRGRVASEQDRTVVESLARARFGTRKVYAPLRLDPGLPASWSVRTLAGLEALDQLADGRVVVRPDVVTVTGSTGDKGASAEISRLLSEKLGEAQDFRVNVEYEETLDPIAAMPTPQECAADINAALARSKITFAPGSAEIERSSLTTVDRIAEILKSCPDVAMEIGGYTDSQGREEMNQALSQRRAEAVVSALLARRVLTTNLKAYGYGEDSPIADNDTEDGREANRRIEFRLVGETRPDADAGRAGSDSPKIRAPSRPDDLLGGNAAQDAAPAEETAAPEGQAGDGDGGGKTADDADPAAENDAAGESLAEEPDPAPRGEADAASNAGAAPQTAPEDQAADAVDGGLEPEAAAADPAPGTGTAAPETVATETEPTATASGPAPAAASNEPTAPAAAEELEPDAAPGETTGAPETSDPQSGPDAAGSEPETGAESAPAAAPVEVAGDEAAGDAADTDPATPDVAFPEDDPGAAAPADRDAPVDAEALASEADAPAGMDPETPDQALEGGAPAVETAASDPDIPEPSTEAGEPDSPDQTAIDADADGEAGANTPDEPAATEVAEAADDAGADTTADVDNDAESIRPRARPPLVVHPDLAGIRPRPRPADIPDAPSTE